MNVEIHSLRQWIQEYGLPAQKMKLRLQESVEELSNAKSQLAAELHLVSEEHKSLEEGTFEYQQLLQQLTAQEMMSKNMEETVVRLSSQLEEQQVRLSDIEQLHETKKRELEGVRRTLSEMERIHEEKVNEWITMLAVKEKQIEDLRSQLDAEKQNADHFHVMLEASCAEISKLDAKLQEALSKNQSMGTKEETSAELVRMAGSTSLLQQRLSTPKNLFTRHSSKNLLHIDSSKDHQHTKSIVGVSFLHRHSGHNLSGLLNSLRTPRQSSADWQQLVTFGDHRDSNLSDTETHNLQRYSRKRLFSDHERDIDAFIVYDDEYDHSASLTFSDPPPMPMPAINESDDSTPDALKKLMERHEFEVEHLKRDIEELKAEKSRMEELHQEYEGLCSRQKQERLRMEMLLEEAPRGTEHHESVEHEYKSQEIDIDELQMEEPLITKPRNFESVPQTKCVVFGLGCF